MSSVILLKSNINDLNLFTSSIKSEHKYIIYNENTSIEDILNLISANTKYLTFVYHFTGHFVVPFFPDNFENNKQKSEYFNFSNNLIDFIKKFKEKTGNLTVDFLSCNINNIDFSYEARKIEKELGINIRFSMDETGNRQGNWILESDKTDIKQFYFNENINKWNYVLTGGININYLARNYPDYFLKNGVVLSLIKNANASDIGITNQDCFIQLENYEVFDGNNYTITVSGFSNAGIIAMPNINDPSFTPIVRNLKVNSSDNISSDIGAGGAIIRDNQRIFVVNNCTSIGTISGNQAGGICGINAGRNNSKGLSGFARILNSNSSGIINGNNAGGIIGRYGGYFGNLIITSCYSSGNIVGLFAGGITGATLGNGGNVIVEGCYSTGNITGSAAGGICGNDAGFIGTLSVNKCFSLGNISGLNSGGICGSYAGENCVDMSINECYSNGNISGNNAGGICGSFSGYDSTLEINNCYSNGTISGSNSGGICGRYAANTSSSGSTLNINNSYSNGLATGTLSGTLLGTESSATLSQINITNCYTNTGNFFKVDLGPINTVNSATSLASITNKIDGSTNWNNSTIWQTPSTNILDLNKYPRLRAFSNPTSSYFDSLYMTFNRRLDYRITGTVLFVDPTFYTGATNSQILQVRSNILDNAFTRIIGDRITTKKENLGFDKQTNASSFTKANYVVLKSNTATRYNIDTIINNTTGAYINLSKVSDNCLVKVNNKNQTITRNNLSTYNFQ